MCAASFKMPDALETVRRLVESIGARGKGDLEDKRLTYRVARENKDTWVE